METKLSLISRRAGMDKKCKFNNLAHNLNVYNLKECFYLLKKDKAAGIDGVSLEEYERNLTANLEDLVSRMKSLSYRPQPVRRVYIPKTSGKLRPLGIPTLEDKIVQLCIARILSAIYENDFVDSSHGFRPNRSCHTALDRLDGILMSKPVNYVIDADIKGFFDNVDHKWMKVCLEERIADKNFLRIIVRFLKSGIIEEGKFIETDKGTPQGGNLSPVLANIYLHFILDLWLEREVKKSSNGYVGFVRYADDFVICVQSKKEAPEILRSLTARLSKFRLELAEEKTRIVVFGRYSGENAAKAGKKPGTFDFLGFTFYNGKTRKGKFKVGIKTSRKKFNQKVKEISLWMKLARNLAEPKEWWSILCAKLRGHYWYFGVSGNFHALRMFERIVVRIVFKWLNRRSQAKSYDWTRFNEYLQRHKLPKPRIYHNSYAYVRLF